MDYLIVLFLSVLSPVALHLSNVDYTTEWGISFSDPVDLNSQKASAIDTGNSNTSFSVLNEEYFGTYGIVYEMFLDYKFYVSDNTWLALRSAYSPLREGSSVTLQPSLSLNPATVAYFYKEHPSFGLLVGYDVGLGFSPYIGASFSHIGYANYGNFELEEQFDSTFTYLAGIRYKLDNNWSALAEVSAYNMDMRYIENQGYDISMRVIKYKFGVVYSFAKPKDIRERNKEEQYKDIIRSLDPTIDDKIQEENLKKAQEEKVAKKQAKQNGKAATTATSTTAAGTGIEKSNPTGGSSSVGNSSGSSSGNASQNLNSSQEGSASQPVPATNPNGATENNKPVAPNQAAQPTTNNQPNSSSTENPANPEAPANSNSFKNDLF